MRPNNNNNVLPTYFVILALASLAAISLASDSNKQAAQTADQKVKLGVYMESLCPDSKRFFVKQLVPTYREIGSIMELKLVPFGHARTLGNGKMVCQHGSRECEGNRRMACIIARSRNVSQTVETIGCIFKGQESVKGCISSNLKDGQNVTYDELEQCTKSDESYQMMIEAEKATGRVGYVPHLKVNDQFSEDIQEQAEHELLKFMCKSYTGQHVPSACKSALAASQ